MAKVPKIAQQLAQVGERFREGYARLHPISSKHLAAVRAAVGKQWDQEQEQAKARAQENGPDASIGAEEAASAKDATVHRARERKSKSHDQDHGHSH